MDRLEFQQGDAVWTKMRLRAQTDLFYMAGVVLGYGDLIPLREGPHRLLCRFIERRTGIPTIDEAKYRKIEMPRETGKTTLLTQCYVIQRMTKDPNIAVLIVNEKEDNSKAMLSEIKSQLLTNELLRSLFPELVPPDLSDTTWSATKIIIPRSAARKEPTVSAVGVGAALASMHYDLIICDDIISREAMENARAGSWQIMHQVNRWIHQLRPLLNSNAQPYPEIVFIGTRWWHGDCYEHIEEHFGYGEHPRRFLLRTKLEGGVVQQIPVYRKGDLAVFRRAAIEDGRSIFPEKWSLDDLAKIRLGDEALFACNYLNEPSNEVTATFKESWLQYYDWLDDHNIQYIDGSAAKHATSLDALDTLIFVDPGGFGTRGTEDRARAAIVVTGTTNDGTHLILDLYSEKDTFLAACKKIVALCQRYEPRKLVIELAGQQAAFIELVRRHLADANLQVSIETSKPGGRDKDQRILGLEPLFQQGRLYVGRGALFHEFRTQYTQFPRSARKDLLDALAYLPEFAKRQPGTRGQSPQERQRRELEAYHQRRYGATRM